MSDKPNELTIAGAGFRHDLRGDPVLCLRCNLPITDEDEEPYCSYCWDRLDEDGFLEP